MKSYAPLIALLLLISCCSESKPISPSARPANWAKAIKEDGLPNLHKVSDQLYRGAQPTAQGFKTLEKMGVKTVLNLRSFHSDRDKLKDTKLQYEHITMKAWHPEKKEVVRFIKIMRDKNKTPVFVHCQHGADRTGTLCAIYRIVFEHWKDDDAIKEMVEGGFGFHTIWDNLPRFIKKLDLETLGKGENP